LYSEINLGFITVYGYGLMIAAGLLCALMAAGKRIKGKDFY